MFGSRPFGLQLLVRPKSPELVQAAMDDATVAMRIERRLRPSEPDNFGMFSSDTLLGIYQTATAGIFAILVGVVSMSLVVGGIVIMNIMLMVVSERTREIGLRKALGARRRDIMYQILTESVTLSTFGGVVGTLLGFGLAQVISKLTPLPAAVQIWSVALGIGITAVVGLFFGLYPAMQAVQARSDRSLAEGIGRWQGMRTGLFREIVGMAFDTLRTSKMRSALTVLGVVIGITSIVGMTSLIRGFDNSLRESISQLGPDTIMVQKWGALSFAAGRSFLEVARRPNLTMEDARGDRAGVPVRGAGRCLARHVRQLAIAHLLRPRAYQAAQRLRRHRELGRGQFRQGRAGPPLHPGRGRAPAQRGAARQRAVAVALPERRSDRQDGPHRQQPVHRDRRARQAAQPGRVLDRGRRFRRHPLRRSREVLRQGAARLGAHLREQLQPRRLPHGDDRRRAARRACATRRCARSRR